MYYKISKPLLEIILGNELAMQLRVNLSIQLPDDDSSLLPIHSDVWSGDLPFESVVWLPLLTVIKQNQCLFYRPPSISK